jgi:predicted RecB family nuclease
MKRTTTGIMLSASDLAGHIACHHLTYLNLAVAHVRLKEPEYYEPTVELLHERGQEFEKGYLRFLCDQGKSIVELDAGTDELSVDRTLWAMKMGADVIYQASLRSNPWQGRADFLVKVDTPSDLGSWSYEVVDAKLARETRAGTILQLCLYGEMVAKLQGKVPVAMRVITPEDGQKVHSYRLDDFMAYFRLVKSNVLTIVEANPEVIPTYPTPCAHCEICRWWKECDRRRRLDDHPSLVASLSSAHATELAKNSITTLSALAQLPVPLPFKPGKGAVETFIKLREQARVQLLARGTEAPVYELLELVEERGLARMPAPSAGDIFFDFEGDPFVGHAGLEYLFGWVEADIPDAHSAIWAFTAEEEKAALEQFVDGVIDRWRTFPDMHIYHFAPYEPAALKRLMGKYATRENEIDTMLRAELFIDLYSITRQALRAGIESYSLKELEKLHAFVRQFELRKAAEQRGIIERHLERNDAAGIDEETKENVRIYNYDDCLSTKSLREFLEHLREDSIAKGKVIDRPAPSDGAPGESITKHQARILPLVHQLTQDVPADPTTRTAEQQARWLLANMLDWYRREKKADWWEYFRLLSLPEEELLEEKEAIAGLKFTGKSRQVKRSFVLTYTFPVQECEILPGESLVSLDGSKSGEVVAVDKVAGILEVKKGPSILGVHPTAVIKFSDISAGEKEDAIIRLAQWVVDYSMDGDGSFRAGRDLLLRLPPRTAKNFEPRELPQENAVAWSLQLDRGVLPIQGPPGTGKSHTAAEVILALIGKGKKVGITALSHKVIVGLMEKVVKAGKAKGRAIQCWHKVSEKSEAPHPGIVEETDYKKVEAAMGAGQVQVLGGTAWLWARQQFQNSVDFLFVDEAGQLSLIDTLAVSQAAPNLVLLGDPQQLKQPQRGSHPEGTEVSALEHVLKEHQTIPADMGILLDQTWRMHPAICGFVSELFYEGRLHARPQLENQKLSGETEFPGAGLWYVPVPHEGNQSSSPEEVTVVRDIIDRLTSGHVLYTDAAGKSRPVSLADIKVITPFNAQVSLLMGNLPKEVQIGTVDKFQGQEAPIVLFSMATSRPEDAPRGMEFLYGPNRLNVAVSRARSTFILVASPRLFEPDCRNVRQMQLANAFCRLIEMKQLSGKA